MLFHCKPLAVLRGLKAVLIHVLVSYCGSTNGWVMNKTMQLPQPIRILVIHQLPQPIRILVIHQSAAKDAMDGREGQNVKRPMGWNFYSNQS